MCVLILSFIRTEYGDELCSTPWVGVMVQHVMMCSLLCTLCSILQYYVYTGTISTISDTTPLYTMYTVMVMVMVAYAVRLFIKKSANAGIGISNKDICENSPLLKNVSVN